MEEDKKRRRLDPALQELKAAQDAKVPILRLLASQDSYPFQEKVLRVTDSLNIGRSNLADIKNTNWLLMTSRPSFFSFTAASKLVYRFSLSNLTPRLASRGKLILTRSSVFNICISAKMLQGSCLCLKQSQDDKRLKRKRV